MFQHLFIALCLLPIACSISCWKYEEKQQGGSLTSGDKQQVGCSKAVSFCVTVKREGGQDDYTLYDCANSTVTATACTKKGTTSSSSGSIYTRTTCCDSDYCNSASIFSFLSVLVFYVIFG